jgi:hypothetical protein
MKTVSGINGSPELQQLAKRFAPEVKLDVESADLQNRSDVSWHTLVFW